MTPDHQPATTSWKGISGGLFDRLPVNGYLSQVVTAEQMRAIEAHLFDQGMPVAALMEKVAGRMASWVMAQFPRQRYPRVAIVVGPGHNGGDGLVIARELHLASVATAIWSPFERHKPLTEAHLRHCLWLGIQRLTVQAAD